MERGLEIIGMKMEVGKRPIKIINLNLFNSFGTSCSDYIIYKTYLSIYRYIRFMLIHLFSSSSSFSSSRAKLSKY